MPKKNAPTRVLGRRSEPAPAPAPAPEPIPTLDEFSADIEAAVSDPEPQETEPRRDKPVIVGDGRENSVALAVQQRHADVLFEHLVAEVRVSRGRDGP